MTPDAFEDYLVSLLEEVHTQGPDTKAVQQIKQMLIDEYSTIYYHVVESDE